MSNETSPVHPTHLASSSAAYGSHSTPLTSTPSSHIPSSAPGTFPDSAHTSYSNLGGGVKGELDMDTSMESSDAGSHLGPPQTHSSGKGKNGATGPAEGKPKPHVCQICQRGFTTGGHLQRHQRIHTGVKAFKCPFPGCETRTSRQDNLQQHYRTHLSPTLRRGSGSAARAAVAAAMEAAGLKSTSARAPRKSKGSAGGTPSSTSAASAGHLPSPYQTPTSQGGPTPYVPYGMYDPTQYGGHPGYPLPPPVAMGQPQSANSSRVPSPVNGHSSAHSSVGSMQGGPGAHHQQPYFSQPFSPAYTYAGGSIHQPYRYAPPNPYGAPHQAMYSPSIAPDHSAPGTGQMYSPMQTGFPTHSRESSYGVLTPSGYPPMPANNGYPPRTQTSTPLSQSHGEDQGSYPRRPPSPHRRSPPRDLLSQGVVDPSNMTRLPPGGGMPNPYGGYGGAAHHMPYAYGSAGGLGGPRDPQQAAGLAGGGAGVGNGHGHGAAPGMGQRGSISSMSDNGSGNGGSEGSGKPLHQ